MAWFTALEKTVISLRVIKAFLVKASLLKTVVNIRCEHKIVLFHPLIKPLSNIRKVNIKSSEILAEIAINNGFVLEDKFSYIIKNPYINIPRNGNGGKINLDNVIVLRKDD